MNNEKIFSMALNLSKPWYVKKTTLSKEKDKKIGRLEIEIDFEVGSRFKDEDDVECLVHDTSIREWQHLNFFEHQCIIKARVPRIRTSQGSVKTIDVPWARPSSGFTLLFEAYSMLLIENEMPVNKVAKTVNVVAHRLWRVFDFWVKKAISQDRLDEVTEIGIDETSFKKGHSYVTVTADLNSRRVIDVQIGKKEIVVEKMSENLINKGGSIDNIKHISMDMSPAFISGAVNNFPNSKIVFDRFHIKQHLIPIIFIK